MGLGCIGAGCRVRPLLLAALLGVAAMLPAQAAGTGGDYKDWTVGCDNILHCEAVGYEPQEDEDRPIALWIARDAGPGMPLGGKLYLQIPSSTEAFAPNTAVVAIGRKRFSLKLSSDGDIEPKALPALVASMLEADEAEVSAGKRSWRLSLAGFKAGLLKIDETQGRLGTPGALVRKGSKPESSVPAAPPVPVLHRAKWLAGDDKDEALTKRIFAEIKTNPKNKDCWEDVPDGDNVFPQLVHISVDEVIVARVCTRGAYQESSRLWQARSKPPYAPKPIALPEGGDDIMGLELDEAASIATSTDKGRGLADCVSDSSWVWTGHRFELLEAHGSTACRGISGVTVRTYTTTVK